MIVQTSDILQVFEAEDILGIPQAIKSFDKPDFIIKPAIKHKCVNENNDIEIRK